MVFATKFNQCILQLIDSVFCLKNSPLLIKFTQTDPVGAQAAALGCTATSVCQLSEWGMPQIQVQFLYMPEKFRYNKIGGQKAFLTLMVFLYNFSVTTIGINQIFNWFIFDNFLFGSKFPSEISQDDPIFCSMGT